MFADADGVIEFDCIEDNTVWEVSSGIELMLVTAVTDDPEICWVDDIELIVLVLVVDVEMLLILPGFVFGIEDIGGEILAEKIAE